MVLRILPVLLLTLVATDLYLYFTLFRRRQRPLWTYLFFLPNILLTIAALILSTTETHTAANMEIMALMFSLYLLVVLPKTVYLVFSLIGRGIGLFAPKAGRVCTSTAAVLAVVLLFIMAGGLTFGPSRLTVDNAEFRSDDLPAAFDGYRIVHISDLHLGSFRHHPATVEILVKKIMNLKPDMIVFTGDLVSIDVDEMDGFDEILGRLSAPDGVYSVMGNHDYINYAGYLTAPEQERHRNQLIDRQRSMGWNLLLNEHRIIRRDGDSIAVVGTENDGRPPFPQRGDLNKALHGLQANDSTDAPPVFKVLLSHDPTHWRRKVLPQTDIQLTLSGHTHGMQFMLFGWSPSAMFYPEWKHMYSEAGRSLYISLGAGEALIPFRFGAWPEISVLTLRRK